MPICPDCKIEMHKAGTQWSGRNKVQRYKCSKCGYAATETNPNIWPEGKTNNTEGKMKIKWQQVQFEDDLPIDQRTELLREYRDTGSMTGYFLASIEGQSTDPEYAWASGVKPSEIDWTGFPE